MSFLSFRSGFKPVLVFIFMFSIYFHGTSQIVGVVTDEGGHLIDSVRFECSESNRLFHSDKSGKFELILDGCTEWFVIKHGYETDTLKFLDSASVHITLKPLRQLNTFVVTGEKELNSDIRLKVMKTDVITSGELKKAACCDLAGCFETQGTVQPMTTNVLTNSKELRILGLSGVYNQLLIDGLPLIQGLSYTYGISAIPGTLVDKIMVAKGASSVVQGFEGMVGQINVIPLHPSKGEKMLLNTYVNSFGESQYNFNFRSGKKKWNNLLSLHMVQPAQKWDRDKDGFLDLPLLTRYAFFDRVSYGDEDKEGFSLKAGVKFVREVRLGGQKDYQPDLHKGSTNIYGQYVSWQQPEVYGTSAWRFNKKSKMALMTSVYMHEQNSWFGSVNYLAKQTAGYTNLQFESQWSKNHDFKTGFSYRRLLLKENLRFSDTFIGRSYAGNYTKSEHIPGLFAENIFRWRGDIISLITGIRADHHNRFGWQITPRAALRYDLNRNATIRASAGTGWRTVNLFSENVGLMVSSRNLIFTEELLPEKSINTGLNFLQKFKCKKMEGFLTFDLYQTRFQNQIFPDYDIEPTKAYISNFTGTSVSNGFQMDVVAKFNKKLEVKTAYNYLDVYRIIKGLKQVLPFNPGHRVLLALSYTPGSKLWRADVNAHWYGKQRLPVTIQNPEEYRQETESNPYTVFNIQVTRNFKRIEFYLGCENVFDFRQIRPIVSWQDPFSPYFDTSFNWGPTRGRELYVGLRYFPFRNVF